MATRVKARSELIPYLIFIIYVITSYGGAVWLEVPSTGTKCVSEDIKQNVVVIADFSVVNDDSNPHNTFNIAARVTFYFTDLILNIVDLYFVIISAIFDDEFINCLISS